MVWFTTAAFKGPFRLLAAHNQASCFATPNTIISAWKTASQSAETNACDAVPTLWRIIGLPVYAQSELVFPAPRGERISPRLSPSLVRNLIKPFPSSSSEAGRACYPKSGSPPLCEREGGMVTGARRGHSSPTTRRAALRQARSTRETTTWGRDYGAQPSRGPMGAIFHPGGVKEVPHPGRDPADDDSASGAAPGEEGARAERAPSGAALRKRGQRGTTTSRGP